MANELTYYSTDDLRKEYKAWNRKAQRVVQILDSRRNEGKA